METLINTLVWAALINGIFLAGLYLFSKKHRSFANQLLGLFLLVIVFEGGLTFAPYEDIGGYSFYYFSFPEVKLFYPILFFHYILEKIGRSGHYRRFLRIHYLLAFAIAGITLINVFLFIVKGQEIKDILGEKTVEHVFMAQQYYAFLLILLVFFLTIKELISYRSVIQKEYSDYGMLNINWLWAFTFSIFPIILAWGADLLQIIFGGNYNPDFQLATWGFVILFLYFVSFKAFRHNNLFEGVPERQEPANEKIREKEKDIKGPIMPVISEQEDKKLILRIRQHMETEEPFLDASLSIHQLAEQLDIPVRELSLLINHRFNMHFFDFVNEYRVDKAREILGDPKKKQVTVLEILYEVGFNSKSSFNTVFKKYTGQTPTEYRRNLLLA